MKTLALQSSSISLFSLAFLAVASSHAAVMVLDLGTSAPGPSYGGYLMAPYAPDSRADGTAVTSIPSPAGFGPLSIPASAEVATTWTWSHGFTDPVYFEHGTTMSLELPANTLAFYLYVQPNVFDAFDFAITASAGLSYANAYATIHGNAGAHGFAFWTDSSAQPLTSISIREASGLADGFAAGEFGIGPNVIVPEPALTSTLIAGVTLGLGLAFRHRRPAA
jgi:hypothetical protein